MFGFGTDKILNFENLMAAGVAHHIIATQGCREGACIHVDFNGAGCFDILAVGLDSNRSTLPCPTYSRWTPGTIYLAGSPAKLLHGIHMEFT